MISAAEICYSKGFPLRKACAFLFLFFTFFGEGFGQDPATTIPTYNHLNGYDLATVSPTFNLGCFCFETNTEDIRIALDTDLQGNLYVLSFGKGIDKYDSAGNPIDLDFIAENYLDNPLDFAIDEEGYIYVADYLASGEFFDNGKIKVFDPEGNFLESRTILTSFYRPLGVAVDDQNVYVAEYNDGNQGPEPDPMSRIRVYDKITKLSIDETESVNAPYRIAINSMKEVYVSQANITDPGANEADPQVLKFTQTLDNPKILTGITSPGSIVVDAFDYVHIIEYQNRINFQKFINYENLGTAEALNLYNEINEGIDNNEFEIKIFDSDDILLDTLKDNDNNDLNIEFPVDLAFNSCDRMYTINANTIGTASIDFDLEIYQRTPSADITSPVAICISEALSITITGAETKTITAAQIDDGSYDLCGDVSLALNKTDFTSSDEGDNTVTLTVTDEMGNNSQCTAVVKVIVDESEDTEDPVITCPENVTQGTDSGVCGAYITFSDATATDNSGSVNVTRTDNTGLNSGDLFPVGTTTISFQAEDEAGNIADCSFAVTVSDSENPTITCPENIEITVPFGEDGKIVTYSAPTFDDNCFVDSVEQTDGLASGSEFPLGDTVNTFVVTDASGKTDTCSFTVTINEAEDTEDPVLTCPGNITQGTDSGECGAYITFSDATATDNSGSVNVTRTDDTGLNSGDLFPPGTTTISFQAEDEAGNIADCSFTVTVSDNEAPVFTDCPASNTTINLREGETYTVPDYSTQLNYEDNCDSELTFSQTPSPNTEISETTAVMITVIDEAGLESQCSFDIVIERVEEFSIQCVENYTAELGYNINTVEIPTADLIVGDTSGIEFAIEIQQFSCADIGEKSIIINATKTETGETASCTVNVNVVDKGRPLIVCPAEAQYREIPSSGVFVLPQVVDLYGIADNCSPDEDLVIVQDPPAGTEYTEEGDYSIDINATDPYGNIETCTVVYSLSRANSLSLDCPDDYEITPNENCEFIVPDFAEIVNFSPSEATISQSVPEGTILYYDEGQDITITASYEGYEEVCTISLVLTDDAPVLVCPSNQIITVSEGESATLPDYSNLLEVYNCGNIDIVQQPAAGTPISEDTEITFIVTDSADREVRCSFNVSVANENNLELSCPEDYEVFADENCQYVVPDFSEIVQVSPEGATIEQSMSPGSTTITNADPFITITASYDGQTESCDIYLLLKDEIAPEVSCIADQTVTIAEGEVYNVPDYRDQLTITDNCEEYEVVQDPAPGSEVTADTQIFFTVTDQAGNDSNCNFQLNIVKEGSLAIACPSDKTEALEEVCSFTVPDYRDEAVVTNGDASLVTQTPAPGTEVTGSEFEVSLRIEENDDFDECSFLVTLEDNIAPQAICISDFEIILNEGDSVSLEPSQIDNGSTDNCGDISLSLDRTEFTSADEGNNTVTLMVTDEAGNVAECETTVQVTVSTVDVNQPPVAYDEEYTTEINTTLNVSAANGVLLNDTDPENDDLTAVLDTDVENGTLQLNSDGSFSYTPDNGFTGQDFFTYQASDGEFNSNTIFVSINVVDNSGDFGCTSQVVLGLGPAGEASLDIELLYHGDAEGLQFSASQLIFDCDDIGENTVTLSYSGRLEGSCEIPVMVVDDTPPVLQLRDISIDLDLQGNASIDFEDINNGSFDECDTEVTYTLSKSTFSCKEVGENIVQVTAEDESGNISTASAIVRVFAEEQICTDPLPGSEYIFIYPNPNSGSFKIATPGDVSIQRIEVFDKRGRFITARNFDSSETEYPMQVGPLQEGIYVLKLETNEGVYVKRMIYMRD